MEISKSIEEMLADDRDKLVVDVRAAKDFEEETYPGAINIFWEDFYDHVD